MPWRGPQIPDEYPTLGFQIADWIEERCAIPDREDAGQPFLLTDEQLRFLLNFYRLDPLTGKFVYYRGAQLVRPQKWGKGPLTAALICAEAQGPVRFSHWNDAGEPVGMPVPTPLIQVTALSEDQAENIYSALLPMIELGALADAVPDTGLGRINLPNGGKIEPVTASARSRLGQRITFCAQDQTESWTKGNKGRALADNQRRNIAGMDARWLSTPNAWDPSEDSVAQYTSEHEHEGVYHDDIDPPATLSIHNQAQRRRALRIVYGDAIAGSRDEHAKAIKPWINLDRVEAEVVALLPRDPEQAERWFLNRKQAMGSLAFNPATIDKYAEPREVPAGDLIVIGVDGARSNDALAIIGTHIETGYQWAIGIWERPEDADEDYEHPMDEIEKAIDGAFASWYPWRVYIDPQYIEHLVDRWQKRWGGKRVMEWGTFRQKQIAFAVQKFENAVAGGDWTFDGDEAFSRHLKQAHKRVVGVYDDERQQMHTLAKDRRGSKRKMDAAMAAVLSWEARSDAIAADAKAPRQYRALGF